MPVNSNEFSAFDEALKKAQPSVSQKEDEFAAFDQALKKKEPSEPSLKDLQVGVSDGTISTTEPTKNAIDLSFDAFNLENQKITRRAPATIGFGTGGGEVVTTEEDPQAKRQSQAIKKDLKAQGYDADKLYDDFKDIDVSLLEIPGNTLTKDKLLQEYKENPQQYEKDVAILKLTSFVNKAAGELTEEQRGNLSINTSPTNTYEETRNKYKGIADRIREYGGNYEKELLKNFSIAVGDYYGQFTNDPSVINDERNKYLNQYQISALQYLEDTNPDAAKGYGSMLVDPSLIKKGSAEEAGWQEKASSLEQIGLRLSKSNIESEILRLANQAKTSPLSIQDVALAKELETKLTDVDNKIKEINIKYPIPAEKEAQTAAMELTDNTTSTWYNRFALSVGNAVDNTFKGVYEFAVEPFMNDEQSKLYQLAAAGESMGMDVIMTLPKEKRISQAYDWQMSPEVSSEYKAIMGNNSLSKDEKTQKVYKLLQENPNGFARIPIIGGKTNISPTSLYYSVTDLAATLTPYLALEAATAGGATAGIARKLASSFMAAAATGFHDNYVAAVREGAANPYKQALITTGIMSFAMAGAGTPQMIRAMAGNKTAIGELVSKLTDKEISVVLDKIKNGTLKNRILDYGKTLGKDAVKSIAEGAKGGLKFESIMAGAKAIDAKIKGKEVHPEELAKEGAIGVLNFTVFGGVMGIGKSAWKGVTDFQGSTLLKASQNPTEYLKAAAKSLADGTITNKDYSQIKNNIELASKVSEGIKFIDDKGVELPESKKAKLLLAKMQEAKLNEDAQGDIPSKLKEDLDNQIQEVKTEIGKIQESGGEMELPKIKEGDRVYRIDYTDPETGKKTYKLFESQEEGTKFMNTIPGEAEGYYEKYDGKSIISTSEGAIKIGKPEEISKPIELSLEPVKAGEEVPQAELPVAEEKPTLTGIEQEETIKQMKPFTDRMVEIERDFKNEGFEIDTDYDNEIVVTDKNGEIVDAEELPDNLRKLAGDYEKATMKLGEFDASAREKALIESRKLTEVEAEVVEPKKAELPPTPEKVTPKVEEKTQEQIAQEQLSETETLLSGEAEKRRQEGKFTKDGVEYKRNEKDGGEKGNSGEVRFTNEVSLPFKYKIVEAETLQPSHQDGIRNPMHFIPEAQPKNRNDVGSLQAEESFANNPRFDELGENTNAYSGAPIVNERNEVVQGNNRSAGLRKGYKRGNQTYKEALAENADKFGFTKEQVQGMKNPVLVREVAVSDAGAIELGNYDVKDLETGGKRRLDPVAITRRLPFNIKGRLSEIFKGDETLNQAIRSNAKKVIDLLSPYLNQAQRNTITKEGELTEAGAKDLESVVQHLLFDGGDVALPDLFEGLSHTQKEGLRKSLPYIFSTTPEKSIVPEIQEAIIALNHFNESGAGNFDNWLAQADMFNNSRTPRDVYSPTAIEIAKRLTEAKNQKEISKVFGEYANEVNDKPATLLDEAQPGVSKKEGIKNIFKTEYDEAKKPTTIERGGGKIGGEQKAAEPEAIKPAEPKPTEPKPTEPKPAKPKEPTAEKVEPKAELPKEEKIAEKTPLQKASEARRAAKAKLDSLRKGLGINEQAKLEALVDYHRTLVAEAKEFIKEKADDINEWAKSIGEKVNVVLQKAWDEAKGAKPVEKAEDLGYGIEDVEIKKVGLSKAEIAKQVEEFGMMQPSRRAKITDAELDQMADDAINAGYNVQALIDRLRIESTKPLEERQPANDLEVTILNQYAAALNAEQMINPSKETLKKYAEALDAARKAFSITGATLRQAQRSQMVVDNLSNFLVDKENAQGAPLTEKQLKEETAKFQELKAAKDALEQALKEEKEKNEKLIAEIGFNKAKALRKREAKKTNEEYKAERKAILDAAKEALQSIPKGGELYSTIPGLPQTVKKLQQLKTIAPFVKEYMGTLINQGVDKLDNVVTDIHAEFKDVVEGVTKNDILKIIAGVYDTPTSTRNEAASKKRLLEREAKLLNELSAARKGEEAAKTEKEKIQKSRRIQELERQIKETRELNREDAEPIEKTNAERLAAREKQLLNKIERLNQDLKSGNFLQEKKPLPPLEINPKTRALMNKVIELEEKIRAERAKDEYDKKPKWVKNLDKVSQVLGVRRLMQTAFDLSVSFRQGATLFSPRNIKIWAKSFKNEISSITPERFKKLMYEIRHSESYHEMVEDGVVFNDLGTVNEDYLNANFMQNIPGIGQGLRASQRAADGFLNTARYELYQKFRKNLERQGLTRQSDPQAYKEMASWVMAMTGRGSMIKALENPNAQQILGNTFYGARLMASRFQLLNLPSYLLPAVGVGSKFRNKEMARESLKDMASWAGTVMAVGAALAATPRASISLNPDDSDFLQVRYGDKVYDISGGTAAYIRTFLRITQALIARTTRPKYIGKKKVEKASESTLKFFRNKLAPNTSYAVDAIFGGSGGREFDPYAILKMYPMYGDDLIEGLEEEGVVSLATILLPNLIGIGLNTYSAKGIVEDDLDTLVKNSQTADDQNPESIKNYNKGGVPITDEEFDKYIDKANKLIGEDVTKFYKNGKNIVNEDGVIVKKSYLELSPDEIANEIKSIKQKATKKAQEELFGVKPLEEKVQEKMERARKKIEKIANQ